MNAPVSGLAVSYILRDSMGAIVLSGTLADIPLAPGWYTLDTFQLSATPQVYTAEYSPPIGYAPDADTILTIPASPADCQGTAYFVRPGS